MQKKAIESNLIFAMCALRDEQMETQQPICLSVSAPALIHNLAIVQKLAPSCEVLAIVKANAYGHGMIAVSGILTNAGVNKFGVATLVEALELRASNHTASIILLAGANWIDGLRELVKCRITPAVGSIYELDCIRDYLARYPQTSPLKIHLDIDTGMSRSGMLPEDIVKFTDKLSRLPADIIEVEGVFTHFSSADVEDLSCTQRQIDCFFDALTLLEEKGVSFSVIHIANSAAILKNLGTGTEKFFNRFKKYQFWVRPGLILYGESPLPTKSEALQPVLNLSAHIVAAKWLPACSAVGYGATFTTTRPTFLAVLGIGYADGIPMALANRAHALIDGVAAPIIGSISMNLLAIDATDAVGKYGRTRVEIGSSVTLLGASGDARISADTWAEIAHSIPYQILSCLAPGVARSISFSLIED